jgi:hypothetical protein
MVKHPKSDRPADAVSNTDDRRARQAAALRENLRKRKQQTRARADAKPGQTPGKPTND